MNNKKVTWQAYDSEIVLVSPTSKMWVPRDHLKNTFISRSGEKKEQEISGSYIMTGNFLYPAMVRLQFPWTDEEGDIISWTVVEITWTTFALDGSSKLDMFLNVTVHSNC